MKLVDPVVRPMVVPMTLAPRLETLDGMRVGLWKNGKLNSAELLCEVEIELRNRHDIAGVVTGTYSASRVMSPEELGGVESCDVVILTNGD